MAFRRIRMPRGADWRETWTWWTDKEKTAAKDLTGWSGVMQLRPRPGSQTLLAEISTANGRMILGSGEGNITVELPQATRVAIGVEECWADCILTEPSGETYSLFEAEVETPVAITQ